MIYMRQPYRRLPKLIGRAGGGSIRLWLYCVMALPWLRFVGDVAKMIGYPLGWRWRLKHKPPDWRGE